MSTDSRIQLRMVHTQPNTATDDILALKPAVPGMPEQYKTNQHSNVSLAIVVLLHALGFWAFLNAPKITPVIIEQKPMMVSLLNAPAPEPEVVPLLPTPPTPEPIVKKITPKVKPVDVKPTPQPVEKASVVEQEALPTPPTPSAPVEVAKAPEVKPEPEKPQVKQDIIEEPKFGVAYLNNPAPNYPAISRRIGEEGRVIMRVLVSVNGEAESVKVENGSGSSRLDEAAVDAVKKWKFVPAKKNKQPISAYVLVPIKFSLDDA